jgi:D-arabinose 5-phosphate isomerase GutQ
MSNLEEYSNKINEEVTAVLSRVDPEQMQTFLNLIQQARKIALYAGGREGLIIRALAMRLFHLDYDVSVVGDMTAPFLTNGDLLILSVSQKEQPPSLPIRLCIYPRRRWQTIPAERPRRSCPWEASTS